MHSVVAFEGAAHVFREPRGMICEDLGTRYKTSVGGLANIVLEDPGRDMTFYVANSYFRRLSRQEQKGVL